MEAYTIMHYLVFIVCISLHLEMTGLKTPRTRTAVKELSSGLLAILAISIAIAIAILGRKSIAILIAILFSIAILTCNTPS